MTRWSWLFLDGIQLLRRGALIRYIENTQRVKHIDLIYLIIVYGKTNHILKLLVDLMIDMLTSLPPQLLTLNIDFFLISEAMCRILFGI